jgi:glutathione S-transferase
MTPRLIWLEINKLTFNDRFSNSRNGMVFFIWNMQKQLIKRVKAHIFGVLGLFFGNWNLSGFRPSGQEADRVACGRAVVTGAPMYVIETRLAPNPRRLRIFLAEKAIDIAFVERDLMMGELKDDTFSQLNPWQRVPVLVLDDGRTLAESVAICRYFEEISPESPLFGRDAFEKAAVEMWQRRVELGFFHAVAQVFRHLHPKMAHLEVPQVPSWGEANRPKVYQELARINDRLEESRFLAGDRYSIADITALVAYDFMKPAKLAAPEGLRHLARWYGEVSSRPSAAA